MFPLAEILRMKVTQDTSIFPSQDLVNERITSSSHSLEEIKFALDIVSRKLVNLI